MTTFEMAQKAFESPGKVFVGRKGSGTIHATWNPEGYIEYIDAPMPPLDVHFYQEAGWQWEEEKQPRKVELDYQQSFMKGGCINAYAEKRIYRELGLTDKDEATVRVKVTAEEVL